MQNEALCLALVDIIWKAGSGLSCIICLLQTKKIHIDESDDFNADGVTERVTKSTMLYLSCKFWHLDVKQNFDMHISRRLPALSKYVSFMWMYSILKEVNGIFPWIMRHITPIYIWNVFDCLQLQLVELKEVRDLYQLLRRYIHVVWH